MIDPIKKMNGVVVTAVILILGIGIFVVGFSLGHHKGKPPPVDNEDLLTLPLLFPHDLLEAGHVVNLGVTPVNAWKSGTTEFMELEYQGEKRNFLYHFNSGECPHCNRRIPVSESLVPWDLEIVPAEQEE